ncbi:MAG TPA: hypothetical protein VGG42_09920 [Acidobacteriaceae bacterium]|jgi:hypothetical protein
MSEERISDERLREIINSCGWTGTPYEIECAASELLTLRKALMLLPERYAEPICSSLRKLVEEMGAAR